MSTISNLRPASRFDSDTELFIVEGKSAANALNQVRSRASQAIFAMQGKIPNPRKHKLGKLLNNSQCQGLFEVLECGLGEACNPQKVRYNKILIVPDGDEDGLHSQSLLLALCTMYLGKLVETGAIAVIRVPAYRLPTPSGEPQHYLYSEAEKQALFEQCLKDQLSPPQLTQFKGLGSMQADELLCFVLDKTSRQEINLQQLLDTRTERVKGNIQRTPMKQTTIKQTNEQAAKRLSSGSS